MAITCQDGIHRAPQEKTRGWLVFVPMLYHPCDIFAGNGCGTPMCGVYVHVTSATATGWLLTLACDTP